VTNLQYEDQNKPIPYPEVRSALQGLVSGTTATQEALVPLGVRLIPLPGDQALFHVEMWGFLACNAFFLSNCQGNATGTWQCLWCPLLAPAAPLIYHRPGPVDIRVIASDTRAGASDARRGPPHAAAFELSLSQVV
jgi:hypothetical protein